MKYSTACSIGILVSFFLPWIYVSFFTVNSYSGYEIPLSLNEVSKIIEFYFGTNSIDWHTYNLWINALFFSIPIFSLINIIKDLSNSRLNWDFAKGFEFGIGVGLIIILYWSTELLNELESKTPKISLGIGFYLTGIFGVVGFITIIIERYWNSEKADLINDSDDKISPENHENDSLESTINKKDLLNQLDKLFELKEKGVLTEEIYEQERQEILSKMQKQNIDKSEIIINQNIDATSTTQENFEDSFTKTEWYKQGKYWTWIIVIFLAALGIWFLIPKGEELSQETIFSELNKYCIKEFENEKKTKGSMFFYDRKYIDSFYSKINKGEDNEINIEFYPAYSRYSNSWKLENGYKLEKCISSYTFLFDTTKRNEYNVYKESKILKIDLNNDGNLDFIVNGYFQDCSGGSGSEGKYFLTFIKTGKKFELTDVLITLPLEYTITGDKIVVKGKYKSWYDESVYDFDPVKNKWVYNKNQSNNSFDEE